MNTLPKLRVGALDLLLAPPGLHASLTQELLARLGSRGEVRVLEGGNRLDTHSLARDLRRQTPRLHAALDRITVARAFTCYQMVTLLAETETALTPTLVLRLLNTFYDENVPLAERKRLLWRSIEELHRLSKSAPVLVSVRPPRPEQSPELVAILLEAADRVHHFELVADTSRQLPLL